MFHNFSFRVNAFEKSSYISVTLCVLCVSVLKRKINNTLFINILFNTEAQNIQNFTEKNEPFEL